MRGVRHRRSGNTTRLALAAILVTLAVVAAPAVSSARVSHQDLVTAEDRLATLNNHLSLLVEQYDQASLALTKAEAGLADARAAAEKAQAEADGARATLSARARMAYETAGSQLDVLLGATSLAQFSDRLEFIGRVAQQDTDAANQAMVTGQAASRAASTLAAAVQQRQAVLKSLAASKSQIQAGIAEQQSLIGQLRGSLAKQALEDAIARQQAEAATQARAREQQQQQVAPPPRQGGGGDPGGPPPPVGSGAAAAVRAAYSVIGVPYVWGGADPKIGFDCSGLTMWSWAQGGVSLPHSAAAQYGMLPHISRNQLQPGDLLFFYSPIHHVALYVGGGMVIEALHPGTFVLEDSPDWPNYVGAARP